ncbi:hypothetical protein [Sphingomonas sp. KR3-1]|uniref:hypothetical protein n=1 Tax=Sphingomonas sp. KR3-1 TaxID=3156611 RepID=UPI0032B49656
MMRSGDQPSGVRRTGDSAGRSLAWRPGALRGKLRARWAAVLLTALLAFCWQSFVTQTHLHFEPAAYGAAVSGQASPAAVRSDTGKNSSDTPATCPICQEIAHGGLYLLPTPVALTPPEPAAAWQAVAASLVDAVRKPSHAWRSRAPPIQLQA